ncbi:DUF2917 domain-containing protein [Paucibacter sp. XJ19-41]|uniref:DUF2917 domain-containing protein n=1 Tax=Paucibacter sp. XJ19-41 TaxID=2927824 RepID=UPI003FA748DC
MLVERELILRCVDGALWVTQHNEGLDLLVEAGQGLILRRSGLAVVQALQTGCAGLWAPHPRLSPADDCRPR